MQENHKHIEQVFFDQIKKLSVKSAMKTYDYQFSDGWVQEVNKMRDNNYPKNISKMMSQAGLIYDEEQRAIEEYLWQTAFSDVV